MTEDEISFCPQCGAPVEPGAQACPNCDAPLRRFLTRPATAAPPAQSFSERYRAASLNQPVVPVPTSPPGEPGRPDTPAGLAGKRSGGRMALILGGVALFVVAGALAIITAIGGAPRPTTSPPAAAATPTPTTGPGTAAEAGFFALIQRPDLSYHLVYNATTTIQGHVQTGAVTLDVAGPDYKVAESGGGLGVAEFAFVASTLYVRPAGKTWTRRPGAAPWTFSPFLDISGAADLEYVGPITLAGRDLFDLQSTGWYRTKVEKWLDVASLPLPPNEYDLDVYVTADGVPVAGKFTMQVNGPQGEPPIVKGSSDFTFSAVGTTPKIVAPIR